MTPQQLRAARRALRLSQIQLAGVLDVPKDTISRWERGALTIRHPEVLRLALAALSVRAALQAIAGGLTARRAWCAQHCGADHWTQAHQVYDHQFSGHIALRALKLLD